MKYKYVFAAGLLAMIFICCILFTGAYMSAQKEDQRGDITVVTSFYPMYIAAANVIGDAENITLKNLSEPKTGCMHDYQLTPEDMKLLSKADIFIVNGGGIESFLSDVAVQYPDLRIVDASAEADLLEDNAHAWMSVDDYGIQVQTISEGLSAVFPKIAQEFAENAGIYQDKLEILKAQQKQIAKAAAGVPVVTFHEAYDYLAKDYGFSVCYTLDLDEERQVSAQEVAELLARIKGNNVTMIFAEELYGSSMGDTVKKEASAEVYYLDTLVRGDYDKDSYINGMQENINILKEAFGVK